MDIDPEPDVPMAETQYEYLLERLQPESEMEERLIRQLTLCSVKLEHIEKLVARAEGQLRQVLEASQDEPSP